VGNSEREDAVAELGEHLSAGRIDAHEYADRAATAYSARTSDELDGLFTDLPRRAELEKPAPSALDAPYGVDRRTGMPYSDRHKVVAGVLQLVLPLGVGRFYSGHIGMGLAQLLLSFVAIGVVWSFIDGILILAGHPTDPRGRPLRP
jgi:hypothetical protein